MSHIRNSNVSIDINYGKEKVSLSPIDLQPVNFNSRTNSPGYNDIGNKKMDFYYYYKGLSSNQLWYRRQDNCTMWYELLDVWEHLRRRGMSWDQRNRFHASLCLMYDTLNLDT